MLSNTKTAETVGEKGQAVRPAVPSDLAESADAFTALSLLPS